MKAKKKSKSKFKTMKELVRNGEKVFKNKERIPEKEAVEKMDGFLSNMVNTNKIKRK